MPAPIRSLPPPPKKRKRNPSSNSIANRIQSLESAITNAVQSSSSLNPLADLLDLALAAVEVDDVSKAIYALYRVFVVLVGNGNMSAGVQAQGAVSDAGKVVRAWLWERFGAYEDLLVGLMKDSDPGLRVCAQIRSLLCPALNYCFVDIIPPNFIFAPKTHLIHFFWTQL